MNPIILSYLTKEVEEQIDRLKKYHPKSGEDKIIQMKAALEIAVKNNSTIKEFFNNNDDGQQNSLKYTMLIQRNFISSGKTRTFSQIYNPIHLLAIHLQQDCLESDSIADIMKNSAKAIDNIKNPETRWNIKKINDLVGEKDSSWMSDQAGFDNSSKIIKFDFISKELEILRDKKRFDFQSMHKLWIKVKKIIPDQHNGSVFDKTISPDNIEANIKLLTAISNQLDNWLPFRTVDLSVSEQKIPGKENQAQRNAEAMKVQIHKSLLTCKRIKKIYAVRNRQDLDKIKEMSIVRGDQGVIKKAIAAKEKNIAAQEEIMAGLKEKFSFDEQLTAKDINAHKNILTAKLNKLRAKLVDVFPENKNNLSGFIDLKIKEVEAAAKNQLQQISSQQALIKQVEGIKLDSIGAKNSFAEIDKEVKALKAKITRQWQELPKSLQLAVVVANVGKSKQISKAGAAQKQLLIQKAIVKVNAHIESIDSAIEENNSLIYESQIDGELKVVPQNSQNSQNSDEVNDYINAAELRLNNLEKIAEPVESKKPSNLNTALKLLKSQPASKLLVAEHTNKLKALSSSKQDVKSIKQDNIRLLKTNIRQANGVLKKLNESKAAFDKLDSLNGKLLGSKTLTGYKENEIAYENFKASVKARVHKGIYVNIDGRLDLDGKVLAIDNLKIKLVSNYATSLLKAPSTTIKSFAEAEGMDYGAARHHLGSKQGSKKGVLWLGQLGKLKAQLDTIKGSINNSPYQRALIKEIVKQYNVVSEVSHGDLIELNENATAEQLTNAILQLAQMIHAEQLSKNIIKQIELASDETINSSKSIQEVEGNLEAEIEKIKLTNNAIKELPPELSQQARVLYNAKINDLKEAAKAQLKQFKKAQQVVINQIDDVNDFSGISVADNIADATKAKEYLLEDLPTQENIAALEPTLQDEVRQALAAKTLEINQVYSVKAIQLGLNKVIDFKGKNKEVAIRVEQLEQKKTVSKLKGHLGNIQNDKLKATFAKAIKVKINAIDTKADKRLQDLKLEHKAELLNKPGLKKQDLNQRRSFNQNNRKRKIFGEIKKGLANKNVVQPKYDNLFNSSSVEDEILITINYPVGVDLNEDGLNELQKNGLDVTSPAGIKYSLVETNDNSTCAILKKVDAKDKGNESVKVHQQRLAITIMNMIDNVIATSDVVNVKTADPFVAQIAKDYMFFLKEQGQEFDQEINFTGTDNSLFTKAASDLFTKFKGVGSLKDKFKASDEYKKSSDLENNPEKSALLKSPGSG